MIVDWDQRDPNYRECAQKELEISLIAWSAEGILEKEILAFMENNILDAKARKEYLRLLNALEQQDLTEEQV